MKHDSFVNWIKQNLPLLGTFSGLVIIDRKVFFQIYTHKIKLHAEPGLVTYNQHINEHKSSSEQNRYLNPPENTLVPPSAMTGRRIMTRQYSVVAIPLMTTTEMVYETLEYPPFNHLTDAAASPRIFY
jgi:hypothetical protein